MTTEQLTGPSTSSGQSTDPLVEEQTPTEAVAEATTEATPSEESADLDDSALQGIFKELGLAEETPSAAAEATEAETQGPRVYTQDELEEEFRKRGKARLKDTEVQGLKVALQQRKGNLEHYLQTKGLGVDDIAPVLVEFDRHHGQAQQASSADAFFQAESQLWTHLNSVIPEVERKDFADRRVQRANKGEENLEAIVKDFKSTVTKEMFTKSQVTKEKNEAKAQGQKELIKRLLKAGVKIPGYTAPDTGNGNGAASNGSLPTIAQWTTGWTLEQRAEALKRDPQIETKIFSRGQ